MPRGAQPMIAGGATRRRSFLGARPGGTGTRFRVWAPAARTVRVAVETGRAAGRTAPLARDPNGYFEAAVPGVAAGDRYRYFLDEHGPYPDPASRYQPEGLHGPSEVVDADAFPWKHAGFRGVPLARLALYELHVGTFTPEGTFAAAAGRLPELRDLGVTAVELMPVAQFPGERNWGYDGAALFAPARRYGAPDDLRRFVDRAHGLGLAVHLDVVYNHFGPDGAYATVLSPAFFSSRHESPWGKGINFDGPGAEGVRSYFIENALHWIREYRFDGLRLDATHAIVDESPRHFLADLAAAAHQEGDERTVLVIAEDVRNLSSLITPAARGGDGLDALWSDDFHHVMRRLLAGDHDGYFGDFEGTAPELARTMAQGWLYTGQHAEHFGGPRGTDPRGIDPDRFVFFIQNHDQVGNRAMGERLHHEIDPAAFRAATVLFLSAPQTPLLFMGQEWGARSPFRFFTDHPEPLGRLVTEGRRREFQRFAAFADAEARARIPDPQAPETFRSSRLDWAERDREPHASLLRLHRALLKMRHEEPAWRGGEAARFEASAPEEGTVLLRREAEGAATLTVARLSGQGPVRVPWPSGRGAAADPAPSILLQSESPEFTDRPEPPRTEMSRGELILHFARPSAVVMRAP
jgi:maltooligosyltrehalose trehalohydrolase